MGSTSGGESSFQIYRGQSPILGLDQDVLVAGFSFDSLVVFYQPVPAERFEETYSYWVATLGKPESEVTTSHMGANEKPSIHRSVTWSYQSQNGDLISVWLARRGDACEPPTVWDQLFPGRDDEFCVRIYNGELDRRMTSTMQ